MRAFSIVAALFLFGLLASWLPTSNHAATIDALYQRQLDTFRMAVESAHRYTKNNKSGNDSLKISCILIRQKFKELSVLTDYLNPYETILLNSPALEKTEDDNPGVILKPHGLQQLELLAWQYDTANNAAIEQELNYLDEVIVNLMQEAGRINKFSDENIWLAMRTAVITICTKTITSFDSPLSLQAIGETVAMLGSMKNYLAVFNGEIAEANSIMTIIDSSLLFLHTAPSFNDFDRLQFIRKYMNPLMEKITAVIIQQGFTKNNERNPLHFTAKNLFDTAFFNIDFFSPNKRYAFTPPRKLLGEKLFYDTRISSNAKRSCASCHKPELAFTDGLQTPLDIAGKNALKRNTPTLLNAVFQTKQFYDSRQTMLEFQVKNVVHNAEEMGGSLQSFAMLLRKDTSLSTLFAAAYPQDKEPINEYTIANALANYMRSLQSLNARFDQYMRNNDNAMNASELNGFNLFMGKAKCGTCHFMPLFNGLVPPQFNETESEVIGVPQTLKKPFVIDSDSGKFNFTKSAVHLYAFKTPTLRNIALTAPYMHNGSYKTLNEVIDFYNNGGGKGLGIAPANQTLPFDKLHLTKKEKKDLVAFLYTLTDTSSYKQHSSGR